MTQPTPEQESERTVERDRRYWDEHAPRYDRSMARFDRWLFADSRAWVCSRARGDTLEVAVGTGRNLALYPDDVRLTGIDLSPGMLDIARGRARELGREVDLREADAQYLPFEDASFDTVVCTLGLCSVPDVDTAVAEIHRVLPAGGRLLLLDHVRPAWPPLQWALRGLQYVVDRFVPGTERFLRRPLENVAARGFTLGRHERFKAGAIERLVAHKPG
ncbi:MAG: class I SAM-dependent methyltransferase [Streptosporangiales bacterium]